MSDGVRSALHWIGIVTGVLGVLCGVFAIFLTAFRRRLQDSTIPRAVAIAVLLLATAAIAGGTAWIWPHPPA